jgi:hypothetical protein
MADKNRSHSTSGGFSNKLKSCKMWSFPLTWWI